jgi:hypothetical protein
VKAIRVFPQEINHALWRIWVHRRKSRKENEKIGIATMGLKELPELAKAGRL